MGTETQTQHTGKQREGKLRKGPRQKEEHRHEEDENKGQPGQKYFTTDKSYNK